MKLLLLLIVSFIGPAVAENSPRPTNKYYGKNYPKLIVFVPSIEPGTANKESEQFKIDWAWGKFNNVVVAIYFCESENTLIEDVRVNKDEIEYPLFWIEDTEKYKAGYKSPKRLCQWLRKNIPPVVAEEPPVRELKTREACLSVTLSESTFERWKIARGVDGYVGTLGNNKPMNIQPALEQDLNGTKRTRDIVILEADKSDRYILVVRLIPWPAVAESK